MPSRSLESIAPSFTLTVAAESLQQVAWCLEGLRSQHASVPIVVIGDGQRGDGSDPEFASCARRFAGRYVSGNRLKGLSCGAAWWDRFFRESVKEGTDVIFKIDPDTHFHRPFKFIPRADYFGSIVTETTPHLVQGGCQGFSVAAARRVLQSGFLSDPLYRDVNAYVSDPTLAAWFARNDYFSTDWSIRHVMGRLGIDPYPWSEVNSRYRDEPANPNLRWAVTHPHKLPQLGRWRIGVLTLSTPEIADYAELGLDNKREYCARHGYDLVSRAATIDGRRPPAWSKVRLVQRHLSQYDWIFWTDADSLVMNPAVPLERFIDDDCDLILASDRNGINSGQMFIRNTPACHQFLAEVYAQGQFIHHPWWEQAAIRHVLHQNFTVRSRTMPQSAFNSEVENYREGDFLLHFPGKRDKLSLMRRYMRGEPSRPSAEAGSRSHGNAFLSGGRYRSPIRAIHPASLA